MLKTMGLRISSTDIVGRIHQETSYLDIQKWKFYSFRTLQNIRMDFLLTTPSLETVSTF